MARGRKSSREKLTERLRELEEAIARQEETLGRLKEISPQPGDRRASGSDGQQKSDRGRCKTCD